jgi:hypothetical protein
MTNKKVVVATLFPVEIIFKVPDGIDLEDKTVVENYWYKYGELHIKYVGKDDIESIEPCYEDEVTEYKYAKNVEIVDKGDYPFLESDEEEEFIIIDKTNICEPFWGKVVNKN